MTFSHDLLSTKATVNPFIGKYLIHLLITEVSYIDRILKKTDATGRLAEDIENLKSIIAVFDSIPFACICEQTECKRTATCYSTYIGSSKSMYFWCDTCDINSAGANNSKLTKNKTYQDALKHIARNQDSLGRKPTKTAYNNIIYALAHAKGLQGRSKREIARFFNVKL